MAKFCEGCGHPLEDNAQFCENCGRKVSGKCVNCGSAMAPGELFCNKCGARAGAAPAPKPAQAQAPTPQISSQPRPTQAPVQPVPQVPTQPRSTQAPAPQLKKKSKAGLVIGLCAGGVALIVLAVVLIPLLTAKPVVLNAFPDNLKVSDKVKVNCQYTTPEYIIPANYRSMDNIVFMTCWTDTGSSKLMVSVEIPGFTQKYEQLIDVSRAETELSIHPPLLPDVSKNLKSSKDAQLVVTVKDQGTGETIVQDTKSILLYSRNDIQWVGEDGTPYDENILAWVTPEVAEIDTLLRYSAEAANQLYGLSSIVGYQQVGDWSPAQTTYAQVNSMMYALANTCGVKYVMAPFSSTSKDLQSVKTPAEVINGGAGLCVETAVTMASAIQRTSMHAVIIFSPGHAQVAVETGNQTGEYLLIETTALDAAAAANFDNVVIYYYTKEEWTQLMAQEGYTAIDCELAGQLHIQAID